MHESKSNQRWQRLDNFQAQGEAKKVGIDRTLALSETDRTELFGHSLSETSTEQPNQTNIEKSRCQI